MSEPPGYIHNEVSGDVHGFLVQVGVVHGDVNLYTGSRVRSGYRHQVERIAPRMLVGRETELAELATFALSKETAGCYRWWRAVPWAGKTALMSSFVLNPPAGVRVVSFFVTARLPGQSDRTAFVDAVLEQLLTILGKPVPALFTATTREAHLLRLLAEAAEACRVRGETLLLVVDGLDEDRGHTTDHDAHSVAGLLPTRLPSAMKVVVAGRPDPPMPKDVAADHPLRDPAVVRPLDVSPHATAQRGEMERDLKRLITGTEWEQDLLGLLTASGGGLSADDLVQLVGADRWRVQDLLDTGAGRSFTRRPAALNPDAPDVYLLGHEELQFIARDMLVSRLPGYLERIHAWADDHRLRGWPGGTSEYLLRGYHAVLVAAGDLDRATRLCTDPRRHDRLRAVTGADHAALNQIEDTVNAHTSRHHVDLTAVGRLTVHRAHLKSRNSAIPLLLPALWARLGYHDRALALAQSLARTEDQDRALELVAAALTRSGDAGMATQVAETIADSRLREQARAAVAAADAGAYEEAVHTSHQVYRRPMWQGVLTEAMDAAEAGDHTRAVELAHTVTDENQRSMLLACTAQSIAESGDHTRALATARGITEPFHGWLALTAVAGVMAWAGDHGEALKTVDSITGYRQRSQALTAVAAALVENGHRAQAAEVVVRAVATAQARYEPGPSPAQLLAIAGTLVEVGETERAVELVRRAEGVARSLVNPEDYCRALAYVAEGFAGAGEFVRATTIARSLAGTHFHDDAMAAITRSMAKAGDHVGVKRIMRLITEPRRQRDASASYAAALVQADRPGKALRHVAHMSEDITHLVVLAAALAEAGHHVHTTAVVDRILRSWEPYYPPSHDISKYAVTAVPSIITALAAIGEHQRASEMVGLIYRHLAKNERPKVVAALTGRGDLRQLRSVDLISSMMLWDAALLAMARTLTGTPDNEGALEEIPNLEPAYLRGQAALALARAFRECGNDRNARKCAARALGMVISWAENLRELSFVSSDAALAMLEESALLAQ